jgi:hypothetical protein
MIMRKLIYWMVLQVLIGLWLIISPYVLERGAPLSGLDTNNVILGATVAFIGIALACFTDEVCTPGKP